MDSVCEPVVPRHRLRGEAPVWFPRVIHVLNPDAASWSPMWKPNACAKEWSPTIEPANQSSPPPTQPARITAWTRAESSLSRWSAIQHRRAVSVADLTLSRRIEKKIEQKKQRARDEDQPSLQRQRAVKARHPRPPAEESERTPGKPIKITRIVTDISSNQQRVTRQVQGRKSSKSQGAATCLRPKRRARTPGRKFKCRMQERRRARRVRTGGCVAASSSISLDSVALPLCISTRGAVTNGPDALTKAVALPPLSKSRCHFSLVDTRGASWDTLD